MASFQQRNKKWSVRFRYVEFGELKQIRLSGFDTKKDANAAYSEFITNHTESKKSEYSSLTFNKLYESYLLHIKDRLKISSFYDKIKHTNKHILPYFGNMKLYKITKKDIRDWQDILNKKGLSYNYKSKLRTSLSSIFKFATLYYELPSNPVQNTEPFKRVEPKKEMEIWSLEEFNQFISCVENLEYKTLFSFLYLTGCRKGEALALTWSKINFDTKMVLIDRNITKKCFDKPYEIVATKTGESRRLLLPEKLIDLLKLLKESRQNINSTNFVFGHNIPLAETSVTREFYRNIEKAKVKKIHLHCLRHSHVSLLISNGENIVMIAKRLGHASIEQTLNTYSHLMPNEENNMISKLNLCI